MAERANTADQIKLPDAGRNESPNPAQTDRQPDPKVGNVLKDLGAAGNPRQALEILAGVDPSSERENNERQQGKVIMAILTGQNKQDVHSRNEQYASILRTPEVVPHETTKADYLRQVRDGSIGDTQYREMLGVIQGPDNSPQALDQKIAGMDKQMKGVLAHFATGHLRNRDHLTTEQATDFVTDIDVVTFEKGKDLLLFKIGENNGREKRQEYEKAFDRVGQEMFGKKWEYMKQIRALKEEAIKTEQSKPVEHSGHAERKAQSPHQRREHQHVRRPSPEQPVNEPPQEKQPFTPEDLREITDSAKWLNLEPGNPSPDALLPRDLTADQVQAIYDAVADPNFLKKSKIAQHAFESKTIEGLGTISRLDKGEEKAVYVLTTEGGKKMVVSMRGGIFEQGLNIPDDLKMVKTNENAKQREWEYSDLLTYMILPTNERGQAVQLQEYGGNNNTIDDMSIKDKAIALALRFKSRAKQHMLKHLSYKSKNMSISTESMRELDNKNRHYLFNRGANKTPAIIDLAVVENK